jgi:hypothetical protein
LGVGAGGKQDVLRVHELHVSERWNEAERSKNTTTHLLARIAPGDVRRALNLSNLGHSGREQEPRQSLRCEEWGAEKTAKKEKEKKTGMQRPVGTFPA